jgi:HK97 family phage major capsid protein
MNARSPIPLRPNRDALARSERRSFVRACTAMALGTKRGIEPKDVVKTWDDARAELILRAASSTATTASASALSLTSTTVLPMLAPAAASSRLLATATTLDLSGLQSIKLPFIGLAGMPPVPFVAEGDPGSVVDLTVSATTLGPTSKLLILSALTREMMQASASNAEAIVSGALALSAEQSLDAALFSNAAATSAAPAGILHGLTPIASAAKTGVEGVADDLALLTGAIGAAGINPDDAVFVTTPALATKIRVLASPKFADAVLSSSSLAAGVVIGPSPSPSVW